MQVLTLLAKMLESYNFDIWQSGENVAYNCQIVDFVEEEIESIADVAERGDYSVVVKADADCHFEIVAIKTMDEDGVETVYDVGDRIRREMESRGLLEIYYRLCEEAANQV